MQNNEKEINYYIYTQYTDKSVNIKKITEELATRLIKEIKITEPIEYIQIIKTKETVLE